MGSFTVDFRFPLDEAAAAKLRQYADSPESVDQPADTLTFGELTVRIDGRIVRPPWSAHQRLSYTDTDWISGIVTQLGQAALRLRAGDASAGVKFQDDPLEIRLTRANDEVRVAVSTLAEKGGELLAVTTVRLADLIREAQSLARRFTDTLSKLDPRLPGRLPFADCTSLIRSLEG